MIELSKTIQELKIDNPDLDVSKINFFIDFKIESYLKYFDFDNYCNIGKYEIYGKE